MTCGTCAAYLFGADGSAERDAAGELVPRAGAPTPCLSCAKVPGWAQRSCDVEFARSHADELSAEHRRTLAAYFRAKATGRFPDDPLADWYAGVLRELEDEHAADMARAPSETVDRLVEIVLVSLRMRR